MADSTLPPPPPPPPTRSATGWMVVLGGRLGEWKIILRNLSANVWENLDNPIKICDFSKFLLIFCMPPNLWCHNSYCLMELYTQISQNFTFHENVYIPLLLYFY